MFCTQCGKEIKKETSFCTNCGFKFDYEVKTKPKKVNKPKTKGRIDLRSIKPSDWETIFSSVEKTGLLLAVDSGFFTGSIASEIISNVVLNKYSFLKELPNYKSK